MRRDVFQAISDPTRREIIHIVSKAPLNLNAIAGNFDVSRPAISKQVKILTECGLITIKQHGRERYCEANLQSLNEVSTWIEQYRVFWTNKLDALEKYLAKGGLSNKKPLKKTAKKKQKNYKALRRLKKIQIRNR